jgi:hypothetical protein
MNLHIAAGCLVGSLMLIPGWSAAQPKPAPKPPATQNPPSQPPQQGQPAQQTASPQQLMTWFNGQLVPVANATKLYNDCSKIADTVGKRTPPPGFFEASAHADHMHNKMVLSGSPFHKGLPQKAVPRENKDYSDFLARYEAELKQCGTQLGYYTKRMPVHLQGIHDALEQSEGKIPPKEGERIGDALEAYDTAQEGFIKTLTGLSNDSHLQGELHQAIVHIVQETTPPPHAKH